MRDSGIRHAFPALEIRFVEYERDAKQTFRFDRPFSLNDSRPEISSLRRSRPKVAPRRKNFPSILKRAEIAEGIGRSRFTKALLIYVNMHEFTRNQKEYMKLLNRPKEYLVYRAILFTSITHYRFVFIFINFLNLCHLLCSITCFASTYYAVFKIV